MQRAIGFLKQNSNLATVAVFIAVGLALYADTFGNQMFWDDFDFILNNRFVRDFSLGNFFSDNVIAGSGLISNYWRPLLLTVFSLEWHLWHGHVFGYHAVNLMFHIADALLLFYFFKNLFGRSWLAFLTGFIFLIHPLQTEAVTYVNSLGDSLSVFFILLALNHYLYYRRLAEKKSYWWALVATVLALLSKETAIVTPLLIALTEFFHDQSFSVKARMKNIWKQTWSFFAIGIFYVILRGTVLNFQNTFNLYNQENIFTESIWVRILTFFRILAEYFQLLFYPHNLHMERSIEIGAGFGSDVLFGLLFFLLLIFLAVWTFRKRPEISFGALWFLICLSPTSNILVPINGLLYEHWLYLALGGFFLMVFGLLSRLWEFKSLRYIAVGSLAVFFIFLSVTTISRNRQWRDPITFYTQTLEYAPDSYRVINNLGMAYADVNDFEMAKQTYEKAIVLDPGNAVAYHNLANSYKNMNDPGKAIENYKLAIEKNPDFLFSYYALAQLYLEQKNEEQAQIYIDQIKERLK